jgi:hypothetical protein
MPLPPGSFVKQPPPEGRGFLDAPGLLADAKAGRSIVIDREHDRFFGIHNLLSSLIGKVKPKVLSRPTIA